MNELSPIAFLKRMFRTLFLSATFTKIQRRRPSLHSKKMDTFHRGYRIQFTEELFTISHIATESPPTNVVKNVNDEIIQGKFYDPELVNFVSTISKTTS